MRVRILRQSSPVSEAYWETFLADVSGDMSIAGLLEHLNHADSIVNENGAATTPIGWECSCLQGDCGGCAMVVNGMPVLACETFVRDLKGDEIALEPLKKFPVIHDLVVDRSIIQDNLRKTDMYIGSYQAPNGGAKMSGKTKPRSQKKAKQEFQHQYAAARCLKCGLCLEICPNYVDGQSFFGALFANDCYLVSARNPEKAASVKESYRSHFGNGCSKSLSCMDVCPAQIPTIASIAKLNRG